MSYLANRLRNIIKSCRRDAGAPSANAYSETRNSRLGALASRRRLISISHYFNLLACLLLILLLGPAISLRAQAPAQLQGLRVAAIEVEINGISKGLTEGQA